MRKNHLVKSAYSDFVKFGLCVSTCLVCLLSIKAHAASSEYEAFDFKKCLRYSITNEPHGIDLKEESREYVLADERARQDPHSLYKMKSWAELEQLPAAKANQLVSVYSAVAEGKNKQPLSQYGACSGSSAAGISCLPNQHFPLAGASYRPVRSKGALQTFACTKGCDAVPNFIYDMGYENMDGERNIEHEAALTQFRKRCGKTR